MNQKKLSPSAWNQILFVFFFWGGGGLHASYGLIFHHFVDRLCKTLPWSNRLRHRQRSNACHLHHTTLCLLHLPWIFRRKNLHTKFDEWIQWIPNMMAWKMYHMAIWGIYVQFQGGRFSASHASSSSPSSNDRCLRDWCFSGFRLSTSCVRREELKSSIVRL